MGNAAQRTSKNSLAQADVAIGELPPRPRNWVAQSLVIIAAALIGGGIAYLSGRSALAMFTCVVAVLLIAVAIVFGERARARGLVVDKAIEGVNPLLGARVPTRALVGFGHWEDGWVGVPGVVRLKYSATVRDSDPRFVSEIVDVVSRRLNVSYRLRSHNQRRCFLVLERTNSEKESPAVVRARAVVEKLMGESSSIATEVDGEGNVAAVRVKHDIGPKIALSGYRARIEGVLSTMLPGRWRARWDMENDRVRFELRPVMPSMILNEGVGDAPELTHKSYMASEIVLATDEDRDPVVWVPSVAPHVLIVGGTGSGKTSLLHTALTVLAGLSWRVWVLDGKRIEFVGFRDWPNVELVASKVEDQVRMVHAAHELMESRYSKIEAGEARVSDFDPLVFIIDEYATFKKRVERWYRTVKPKGAPPQPPVFDLIGDIARLGRSAKVHLIIGIQRPDVTFLDGEMRDNFASRFSLGRLSPQGAKMMWDSFAVGVVRTPQGRGIGLGADGDTVEMLGHYTPDPAKVSEDDTQMREAIERLKPTATTYPRKMIEAPRAEIDETGKSTELIEPDYYDYASARIVAYDPDRAGRDAAYIPAPEPEAGVRFEPAEEPELAVSSSAFEGYDSPESGSVEGLVAGDLVLVDETLELWGVVETAEPDIVDDSCMAIDYRDIDTGEPNTISISADETVSLRRPEKD